MRYFPCDNDILPLEKYTHNNNLNVYYTLQSQLLPVTENQPNITFEMMNFGVDVTSPLNKLQVLLLLFFGFLSCLTLLYSIIRIINLVNCFPRSINAKVKPSDSEDQVTQQSSIP